MENFRDLATVELRFRVHTNGQWVDARGNLTDDENQAHQFTSLRLAELYATLNGGYVI